LAGCLGSDGGGNETVKLGVVVPQEGAYAFLGTNMEDAVKLLETQINENGGLLGNDVEVVARNGKGESEASVSAARQLIDQDDVDALGGCVSTSAALAVSSHAVSEQVIYSPYATSSPELSSGECNRFTFMNGANNVMVGRFGAQWTAENVGRDFYIMYPNYAYGESVNESWTQVIEAAGGSIVGRTSAPLGTDDFSAVIDDIRSAEPDAIVQGFAGTGGIAFYQQAAEEGLTDIPMMAPAMLAPVAAGIPESVSEAVDIYGMLYYDRAIDNEKNRQFVEDYVSEYNTAPNMGGSEGWVGAQMYFKAVREAGTTDTDDVISEYEQLSRETILGTVSQRACDHQAEAPYRIGLVQGTETVGDSDMPVYEFVAESDGSERLSCGESGCDKS
jgi:branched-chain amino acid transport system substrate-binding protein